MYDIYTLYSCFTLAILFTILLMYDINTLFYIQPELAPVGIYNHSSDPMQVARHDAHCCSASTAVPRTPAAAAVEPACRGAGAETQGDDGPYKHFLSDDRLCVTDFCAVFER